ncbi:MAG: imidazole glycerol phosphate synthase subunit HisH [Bdellovibrionales bacterium]
MIAILDSGTANLTSVAAAFERMDIPATITSNPNDLRAASHVILPGVGSAGAAIRALQEKGLLETVCALTQPVLGICLGMQILFDFSEESEGTSCLGVVPGKVKKLDVDDRLTLPHMGWNNLETRSKKHPLLHGIENGTYMYFVHSFAAPVSEVTLAICTYGQSFTAMCSHKNFYGCQFHPERSGEVGARILRNFMEI